MSDDPNHRETPATPRRGILRFVVPIVAFFAGGAIALTLFEKAPPPPTPDPQLSVPTARIAGDAAAQEAALYRQINDGFVRNLRDYHSRLREIAEIAEAEGASSAAQEMRDFALETELVIQRYDKIVKGE